MTRPTIVPRYRMASASSLIDALGHGLSAIKEQDGLTDAELGTAMGKGADQGGKYRTGLAEMGVVAFFRAAERWNGRFANDALAMIGMKLVPLDRGAEIGRSSATCLTKLLLEMSNALEDGQVDDAELAAMRASLDEAGRAIDGMRERLSVRAA